MNASGFDAKATSGKKGQFDIVRNGELLFSKHEAHRFPEPGEVLSLLRG